MIFSFRFPSHFSVLNKLPEAENELCLLLVTHDQVSTLKIRLSHHKELGEAYGKHCLWAGLERSHGAQHRRSNGEDKQSGSGFSGM